MWSEGLTFRPPLPATRFCQTTCTSQIHSAVRKLHAPPTFTQYSHQPSSSVDTGRDSCVLPVACGGTETNLNPCIQIPGRGTKWVPIKTVPRRYLSRFLEVKFPRFHTPAAFTHYSFLSEIVSTPESQLGRKASRPGHLYPLLVSVAEQVDPAVLRSYVSQISRDGVGF
jgi:hypothetical protein